MVVHYRGEEKGEKEQGKGKNERKGKRKRKRIQPIQFKALDEKGRKGIRPGGGEKSERRERSPSDRREESKGTEEPSRFWRKKNRKRTQPTMKMG